MANILQIRGQVSLVNTNLTNTINLTDTLTTTGSNFIVNNASITTSSWFVLDQASNTNYRYGVFCNLDATSSLKIALGASATASWSAYLEPGDVAVIPNSGSLVLYSTVTGTPNGTGTVILQYLLVEN